MASVGEKFPMPNLYLQTPPSKNQTFDVIPPQVKEIWERWNIRGLILFSLSLQTFLILCAPLRKRTSRKFPIFLIWSAYLLADWTANFIIGQISNDQSNSDANVDLLTFWTPFLLLHLGGPDTISAFALEDNALWLRHLIGLVFQVVATVYVFIQTLPQNKLWVPAVLIFLAGIIKYAERTRALYLASLGSFRASMLKEPDPGPDYAKLMEEFTCKKAANLPTTILLVNEPNQEWSPFSTAKDDPLSQLEVVQYAFLYFNKFKGLIVDLIFSFKERNESRDFFLKRNSSDTLKVIEVELNFIYEVLFTKVVVLHKKIGMVFRFISVCSVTVALVLFSRLEKTDFRKIDVRITYALLIGALALDFISISMTAFSDWTIATHIKDGSIFATMFERLLRLKGWRRESVHKKSPFSGFKKLDTPWMFRRWCESVSQFNLIAYCLSERIPMDDSRNKSVCCGCPLVWKKTVRLFRRVKDFIIDYLGTKELLDDWKYVSRQPVLEELWDLIFKEMLKKSKAAESVEVTEEICSSRGSYVLKLMDLPSKIDIGELISNIEEVAFDESLMLWHIATELCYRDELNAKAEAEGKANTNTKAKANTSAKAKDTTYREFSKLLSDYMLYLIVMLPSMMSAVAGIGEIRFRDTCAEAKKFFDQRGFDCSSNEVMKACLGILEVNVNYAKPVEVKGDKSKSVLFNGSLLAKKLQECENKKWEIMIKVWIEMLGYAASHCRPDQHVQQVSKGGELITIVWLLMAHFGLGEQFQINEGHARAKLIVRK